VYLRLVNWKAFFLFTIDGDPSVNIDGIPIIYYYYNDYIVITTFERADSMRKHTSCVCSSGVCAAIALQRQIHSSRRTSRDSLGIIIIIIIIIHYCFITRIEPLSPMRGVRNLQSILSLSYKVVIRVTL